jgi:hypothetical protein
MVVKRVLPAALAAASALCGFSARAADEEIQVYMDEIGPPHRLGLDVHLNFVPRGRVDPDFPGEEASGGRFRVTPEWSYALDPNLELGLYLPLAEVTRRGDVEVGGAKARIKWVAPRPQDQDWFWGLNFEIGRVRHQLDRNPWNAELKGILGTRKGPWTLAANLNVDFVVSGPAQGASPDLQLALKVAHDVGKDLQVGVESYNGLGTTHRLGHLSQQDHQTYLVVDKGFGRWDLNFGVGYGYGRPEDEWIVKAIVGVPIGPAA